MYTVYLPASGYTVLDVTIKTAMGQLIQAIIEHTLSPAAIVSLSKELSSIPATASEWKWTTSKTSPSFLQQYWKVNAADFIRKRWSFNDLATLECGRLDMHFFAPNLVVLAGSLRSSAYYNIEKSRAWFNGLSKQVAQVLGGSAIIMVPDGYEYEDCNSVADVVGYANAHGIYYHIPE